ncbi:MAG: phospholipase D-like domain-containing protein [Acidithiobacillus sp.]
MTFFADELSNSGGSVTRMVSVIDQPGPVDIESEEMGEDRTILSAIAAKGHAARVILPASISAEDQRNVADLEQHGVQVRLMPKSPIYMHAKAEIAGDEAFIGSENYSTPSLRKTGKWGWFCVVVRSHSCGRSLTRIGVWPVGVGMSPPTRNTGAGSRIGSKTGGIITDKILIPELPAIPAASTFASPICHVGDTLRPPQNLIGIGQWRFQTVMYTS